MWTDSLLHSRFQCRHATLLPTNGCWDSNHIPFPLCLLSNEQTNHVYGTWQYVSHRALRSGHASQFSTNESIVAEFGWALWLQATKRSICRKVCFKRLTKFQVKKRLLPGLVVVFFWTCICIMNFMFRMCSLCCCTCVKTKLSGVLIKTKAIL